jgi:hypothetical protein
MTHYLKLHPSSHAGEGSPLTRETLVKYDVQGMPEGEEAWIALMHGRWQIYRLRGDTPNEWHGEFSRAEDAREFLEAEVNSPPDPKQPCPQCHTPMQPRRHWPTTSTPDHLDDLKPANAWRCGNCGHEIPRENT